MVQPHHRSLAARLRARAVAGALLAVACIGWGVPTARAALEWHGDPLGGTARVVRVDPASQASARWDWRWALPNGWTDWYTNDAGGTSLALPPAPPGAMALELRVTSPAEDGPRREVMVVPVGPAAPGPDAEVWRGVGTRRPAAASDAAAKVLGTVSGSLGYRDRHFDLQGYTGTHSELPMRRVRLEIRRSSDDSLLSVGSTDEQGDFSLGVDLVATTDLRLVAVASLEGVPGLDLVVRPDLASPDTLRMTVGEIPAVAPGSIVDTGPILAPDPGPLAEVQAFHLLDLLFSAAQMVADSSHLGAWPGGGDLPDLVWSPDGIHATTRYEAGAVVVASPGSGDSDAWSDGPVLAAFGQWVLSQHGTLTSVDAPAFTDLETDAARAFDLGSAWTFAASVRAWRGLRARDLDGALGERDVSLLVDLPTPPPLGFSAGAEAGFDLERRTSATSVPLAVRGQLGVWNVAAMGWDLADGPAVRDGDSLDDDGIDRGEGAWFQRATDGAVAVGARSFEELVEAWRAELGDDASLDAVVVDEGACALYDDAAEEDDDPASARPWSPWIQPPLDPQGTVQIHELFLDDRDGVELMHRGDEPIDVGGWTVTVARNGFGAAATRSTTLPPGTWIAPGRCLVLWEGDGTNGPLERFDPDWFVPWTTQEDGACTLVDDAGVVRDFVRWSGAGGTDPSTEPVPPGTSFTGTLIAPGAEGSSLGRGPEGVDTDHAADFAVRAPTPRLPNVDTLVRTLRPVDDPDHLAVKYGEAALVEVHAWGVADDARPRWDVVDATGTVLESRPTLALPSRGAWGRLWIDPAAPSFLRLSQDAAAQTSAAVAIALWVPADPRSALPVSELRARAQRTGILQDEVVVEWTPRTPADGFEFWLDGALDAVLGPGARTATRTLPLGSHRVEVRAVYAGASGPGVTTGCWVGVTPCAAVEGFEAATPFLLDGMAIASEAASGLASLHDVVGGGDYPVDDVATATLSYPVDLTSASVLSFRHAAHVAPDGDLARVQLSVDDGVTWVDLDTFDGADQPGGGAGTPHWLDGVLLPEDWVLQSYDLAAYAGERVRLRFRRESNATGTSIGWWIDEVIFGTDQGGEWWVSPGGHDVHGCGVHERPWATIAHALPSLAAGDTLRLTDGDFAESISVTRGGATVDAALPVPEAVTVRGAGADSTRIVVGEGLRGVVPLDAATGLQRVESVAVVGGEIGLDVEGQQVVARDVRVEGAVSAVVVVGGDLRLEDSVLRQGDLGVLALGGSTWVERSTIDGFGVGLLASTFVDSVRLTHSLVTNCRDVGVDGFDAALDVRVECSGLHGSPIPVRAVSEVFDVAFDDPLYCAVGQGDLRLSADSPYLDLAGCGPVGALGLGCDQIVVGAPGLPSGRATLQPPFPNPFNPRTSIRFDLPRPERVTVTLYDLRGRHVRTLLEGVREAGAHEVVWKGEDARGRAVASGVYTVVLRAGDEELRRRAVLLR